MKLTLRSFLLSLIMLALGVPAFAQQVIATIPVGRYPEAVAVNAKTNTVWVSNTSSGTVSVIDGSINQVVQTITVGTQPWSIWFSPRKDIAYISNCADQTVTIIGDNIFKTVPTPFVMGCNQEAEVVVSTLLYVPDPVSNQVQVVDLKTLKIVTEIPVPVTSTPFIVANPAAYLLYVAADVFSDTPSSIVVIDTTTNTVVNTFSAGDNVVIGSIAIDPLNSRLYAAISEPGPNQSSIAVLDATTGAVVGNTGPLGAITSILAVPKLHKVLATGGRKPQGQKWIRSLVFVDADTLAVTANVEVGQFPVASVFNPVTGTIYVVNNASLNVSVVGP